MQEKIAIGKILKPHGVKGDFLFHAYSGVFNYNFYPQIYLFNKGIYQSVKVVKSKIHRGDKNQYLVQLEGIDRNFLDFARGLEIFIDELPYSSLAENEYFYKDLENCDVYYNNEFLGKVIGIHNFSGPDIVEVDYMDKIKAKSRSLFLPMQEPFLKALDIKEKKIVFEEIDGFL